MVNDTKELKRKLGSLKFKDNPITSQTDLAKRLGIPATTLNTWGKDEGEIRIIKFEEEIPNQRTNHHLSIPMEVDVN
jgi:DNA-binding XRE family transcriptional regulator